MFDLSRFRLQDMTACSAALRQLGTGAPSIEAAADRITRYLYTNLTTGPDEDPGCVLVRLFKTHPYHRLSPELQALVEADLGEKPADPAMKCLTLLASTGAVAGWNDPAQSRRYRVIPLAGPEALAKLPMFSQLFAQFHIDLPFLESPSASLLLDPHATTFNAFHVPEALESPYVPGQQEFIAPFGIQSVFGFGGLLQTGEMFAAILFAKVPVSRETADLVRTFALSVNLALAPFEHGQLVLSTPPQATGAGDPDSLATLQHRLETLEAILAVQEQVVEAQSTRLESSFEASQRQAKEIQARRLQFETLATTSPVGIFQTDAAGSCLYTNSTWQAITGLSLTDSLGDGWSRAVFQEDQASVCTAWDQAAQSGQDCTLEFRVQRPDGAIRWVHTRSRPLRNETGQIIGHVGTTEDITERKHTEAALQQSEARYRRYFELGLIGMAVTSLEKGWVQVNDRLCEMFGYSREALTAKTWSDLTHPDDVPADVAQFNRVLAGDINGYTMDKRFIRKDGRIMHASISASAVRKTDGSIDHFVALVQDITERILAEQRLAESQRRLQRQIEEMPIGHIVWDRAFCVESWNPAAERIFGFTAAEAMGRHASLIIPEEFHSHVDEIWQRLITGETSAHSVNDNTTKDGCRITCQWINTPLRNEDGHIIGAFSMVQNVTEQRHYQDRLREMEERWTYAFEGNGDGVWDWDATTNHVYFSPRWKEMLGFEEQEIGNTLEEWSTRVHPDDLPKVMADVQRHLRGETPHYVNEHRLRCKDGTYKWILDRGKVVTRSADGTPLRVVGTHTDTTVRRALEHALDEGHRLQEAILANAVHAIIATDPNGIITAFNPAAERMLGYRADEMIGLLTPAVFHDSNEVIARAEQFGAELGIALAPGFDVFVEKSRLGLPNQHTWTYVRKDGVRFPVLLGISTLRDAANAITGYLGIAIDLSECQPANQDFAEAYRRINLATESGGIGVWDYAIPENRMTWDQRMFELYGYTKDTFPGTYEAWADRIHPEDKSGAEEGFHAAVQERGSFNREFRILSPGNPMRYIKASAQVLKNKQGNAIRMIGISYDVTQRANVAATQQEQEIRLKAIVDHAIDGIITIDDRGLIETFNPAAERLFGYTAAEIIGQNVKHLMPEPYHSEHDGYLTSYQRTGQAKIIGLGREVIGRRKDGSTFSLELGVSEMWINGHRRFTGIVRDITERKQAETQFKLVVESAPNGMLLVDGNGLIVLVNAQLEQLFGYQRQELLGQPVERLIPERFQAQHSALRDKFFSEPSTRAMGAGRELYGRHKNGREFPVEVGLNPIATPTGMQVLASVLDISERTRRDHRRALRTNVFKALVESVSPEQATLDVLACICQSLGWDVGELWTVDSDQQRLRCIQRWTNDQDRYAPFLESSKTMTFARGQGLPGRVWSSESPHWISDVTTDSNFPRANAALQVGLRGALAFPIQLGGTIEGVIECFSSVFREPDHDLLETFADISLQIGGFLSRMQADAVQRHHYEQNQSIMDHALDAVISIDEHGHITEWNAQAETIFGWSRPEALNRDVADTIIPPVYQDAHREGLARYLATGEGPAINRRIEITAVRRTGEEFPVELAIVPIQRGLHRLFSAFIRDISERRQSEQARLTLQQAIEHAHDGIALLSADGHYIYMNPHHATMFGFKSDELLGKTWRELYPPEWAAMVEQIHFPLLQETGYWQGELVGTKKAGDAFDVDVALTLLTDPHSKNQTLLWTCRDISQRKQMERELMQAKDAAESGARAKAEFLATMSHEIRTPMNGVLGMTGLLLDTTLNTEQQDYVRTLKHSGESLMRIINDILDFSKIESGKMTIERIPFDLRLTIEDTLELLAPSAQDKHLELVGLIAASLPTAVVGDPGRIRQILTNLIGNAIKFTETGEVLVQVMLVDEESTALKLRFEIIDTGVGLNAEAQARLFQSFTQADSSTARKYGGTGLGLAICKRLTELMGGEIGMYSIPGTGTCVWFTLLLEAQPHSSTDTTQPPVDTLEGLRICLVDDNATNRSLLQYHASAWKMPYDSAEDGAGALLLLRQAAQEGRPFDLAIVDMHMPGMDGMQLGKAIREDPTLHHTRLVLLTSLGRRGDAKLAHTAGFSGYLTKPVRKAHLYDCLRLVMGQPLSAPADQADATSHPLITRHQVAQVQSQIRLLVVDDNLINQKVAVKMLEKLGYAVDVAGNGKEALLALTRHVYHLVFMDCQMPEMDGFETTRMIRGHEQPGSRLPIIAMTANAMEGDRDHCLSSGMDDFVSKPVKSQDLQRVLATWLNKPDHRAAA